MTTDVSRYDHIGLRYGGFRMPDARIGSAILRALGDARVILNVGAGTGSYEPADRVVTTAEPSMAMIRQRDRGAAPVTRASADQLPFRDGTFDAALAVLTVHHWSDRRAGLQELRRVARRIVVLTWDPAHDGFWLVRDYFRDILDLDRSIFPTLAEFREVLGDLSVYPIPIAHDCTDGFLGAYWRRPEAYLNPDVRSAISSFSRIGNVEPRIQRLRADLRAGDWLRRNGDVASQEELDVGYRLVVAETKQRAG